MSRSDRSKVKFIVLACVCVILVAVTGLIAANHLRTDHESLSETDQAILSELNAYCAANEESEIWKGFGLEDKTILAVHGFWGKAYLINPTTEINSIFAAKIAMPEGYAIDVYRISAIAPTLYPIKLNVGNFNAIGETHTVLGNDVYFTKYDAETSVEAPFSSEHYITFLSHEAFHYYMQENWGDGSRFSEELSPQGLNLLSAEYDVLARIQAELLEEEPSRELLLQSAEEYVSIMEQRIAADPQYLEAELSMETIEGTAQYVGICASRLASYDYDVMYFDNVKNVSFADVIPTLAAGSIEKSFLADRMPYETGALLCELLDALATDGWQETLNRQAAGDPITLYAVLKNAVAAP